MLFIEKPNKLKLTKMLFEDFIDQIFLLWDIYFFVKNFREKLQEIGAEVSGCSYSGIERFQKIEKVMVK